MNMNAWKESISMLERYESVQSIAQTCGLAIATRLEGELFQNATSLENYQQLCREHARPESPPFQVPTSAPPLEPKSSLVIGAFEDCRPVGEGLTSRVYRSGDKALKQIVYPDAPPHSSAREVKLLLAFRRRTDEQMDGGKVDSDANYPKESGVTPVNDHIGEETGPSVGRSVDRSASRNGSQGIGRDSTPGDSKEDSQEDQESHKDGQTSGQANGQPTQANDPSKNTLNRESGVSTSIVSESDVSSVTQKRSPEHIIQLLSTFHDQEGRLVLVFPYYPLTLATLLHSPASASPPLSSSSKLSVVRQVASALDFLHSQDIIHRDVKPSAVLLASPDGPAVLSDFGTAWHPEWSATVEPPRQKVLDIGTGPYRAPETLFGNKAYGTEVDLWALGVLMTEVLARPHPKPLFTCPPAHEDGSQLALILSIFQTLGTPTRESWPEAESFLTPPFAMYRSFPGRAWWDEDFAAAGTDNRLRAVVSGLLQFQSTQRWAAARVADFLALLDKTVAD